MGKADKGWNDEAELLLGQMESNSASQAPGCSIDSPLVHLYFKKLNDLNGHCFVYARLHGGF